MAKKKSRSRKKSAASKKASGSPAKKSAKGLVTRSRIVYFLIAIAFWGVVWGLLSLRDQGISSAREDRARAYQARLFLQEIEIALASYQKERGTFPPCPDEKNGGAVLFEKLLAGERRYLGPRPDRIRHGATAQERTVIIDPWGDPIRYRTGSRPGGPVSVNADYDLWSVGGDPGNSRDKWITP